MTTQTITHDGVTYQVKQTRPVRGTDRHVWAIWQSGRFIGSFESSSEESALHTARLKLEALGEREGRL